MDIRHPVHPDHASMMDTQDLRENFLVESIFVADKITLTYSHIDRIIFGGVLPVSSEPTIGSEHAKALSMNYFLESRELGVINLGGTGEVIADGETFKLEHEFGLYIGMGTKEVKFRSLDKNKPAKFYLSSAPAHHKYPNKLVTLAEASPVTLGEAEKCNRRTINKYLHPAVLQTCQLSMGLTKLEPGSIWNTMPSHTHERRMEVYLYTNMTEDTVVFHMMGEPDQTRHIVVRNDQAVISPSWSIHSGVGTSAYSFIWSMCGENKVFDDMDHVAMKDLM